MIRAAGSLAADNADKHPGEAMESRCGAAMLPPFFQDRLYHWAMTRPDRIAFTFLERGEREGASLTYRELHRRAAAVMHALLDRGLSGKPVLLMYPPGLEYIAAFCGCLYAGAIAVPVPYLTASRSNDRILAIAGQANPAAVLTMQEAERTDHRDLPALAALDWISTNDLDPQDGVPLPVQGSDVAFLQFTSGSTSAPKGVMISHAGLAANLAMIATSFGIDERDVVVSWLPAYHDMGLVGGLLQPISAGIRCILMSPLAFLQKPVRWLRAMSDHGGTISGAPNFAFDLCARAIRPDQLEGLDLSRWALAFCGAEPVRPDTLESFARVFGKAGFDAGALYSCYGMAEATLLISGGRRGGGMRTLCVDADALATRSEVCTVAANATAAKVVASSGRACEGEHIVVARQGLDLLAEPGHSGEICIAGPHLAQGYWAMGQRDAKPFLIDLDGSGRPYFRTGDLGFLHDGDIYVTGRLKDILIVRGAKHHAEDVEATAMRSHPGLTGAMGACFTIERDGVEAVVLLQELNRKAVTKLDGAEVESAVLRSIVENHGIRIDDLVLVRPGSLPQTTSGKIQRAQSRSRYLAGEIEVVAPRSQALKSPASSSTLDADYMVDPYALYRHLQADGPIHWNRAENAWMLTRREDVAAVMASSAFRVVELASTVTAIGAAASLPLPDLASVLEAVLFLRNPPGHGEARRFLVAVMADRPMASFRPVIDSIARELLEPIVARGGGDAITEYADLLPPTFMGQLLGLPAQDLDFVMRTVIEVTKSFDRGRSLRFYGRVNEAVATARCIFLDAIADRRRQAREDGLTRMIALSDARFHLADVEIASHALFLLIAGVETTSALIANAIGVLLADPASAERCRADPALIDKAIEEVLRFDGPVQQATRIAAADCVIAGQQIATGDRIVLLLGAAHRDPAAYKEPDRFNLDRQDGAHLGFGAGLHFCIGASLARLEGRSALEALLALHPRPVLGEGPSWWEHRTLRRLKSLRVTVADEQARNS